MTYPYSVLTVGRTDATPNLTTQAADHNAYGAALNDLLVVLGLTPAGSSADLSARLTAIEAALTNFVDLRGTYNASGNVYPSTGGSGVAGAVKKGDLWVISTAGTLGGTKVSIGDWVFALVDTPGQTAANWDILKYEFGYVPASSLQTKATATITPSATANTYGTASTVTPAGAGPHLPLSQVKLAAGGTFAGGETVTARVTVTYSDATTANGTFTFTANPQTYNLTATDLYALVKNNVSIVSIAFDTKSSATSSAAYITYQYASDGAGGLDDTLLAHKSGAAETIATQWTITNRPYLSDSLFFNGIDPTGAVDASTILTSMNAAAAGATVPYVQTVVLYEGQLLYVNPSTSLTCANLKLEFRGGKVRVEPGKTFITNMQDPGLITVRNTRVQQLNITATGGTFILHGGSSSTSTGSSTTAITVSGLTSGTLQTAIQSLTGFSAATVTGSAGAFVVTFANDLTNLTVDPGSVTTATGGTVIVRHGVFAPLNQSKWHPVWWGQVGTNDDTPSWTGLASAAVAVQYTDAGGNKTGQWVEAPIGKNQFFGVRVKACYIHADPGLSYFFPPNWDPQSGDMLILGDQADATGGSYTTMDGGYWRTWNSGQAVNLIMMDGARGRVRNQYIGGLAFGAVGIAAGRRGMAGTTTPEVLNIRGVGNTTQRRIIITATGGTVVFRGGAIGTFANQTGTTAISGVTAASVQFAIRTITGLGAVTVALSGGVYTVSNMPSLAVLDVDPTLATGGTVTTSAYGTMVEVNSPDFRGHNIWGGSFQYMVYGKSGGGRLTKVHPWSCDKGITGDDGAMRGWHIDSNVYLDTNSGWGIDLPGAIGTQVKDVSSHSNGYYFGTGSVRIWKTSAGCEDNVLDGIFDDDYGTAIMLDGAGSTDVDVIIRSQSVRQAGAAAHGTYGLHITSTSTKTKVRGRMRNSDFLARALFNESTSSDIELDKVRYRASAQGIADYTDSSVTYSTMCGPIPYEALDEWDFEYSLRFHGTQSTDARVRINPSGTGTGMDGWMHTVNAPNSAATSGTATSLVGANAVRLNTTGALGVAFGTLDALGVTTMQVVDGKGHFKAGTAISVDGGITPAVDNGNLYLQVAAATANTVLTPTDIITNGTTTITSAAGAFSTSGVDTQRLIHEAGNTHIPTGTYIVSVTNANTAVVNNVCATSSGVGFTATIDVGATTFFADECVLTAVRRA